MLSMMGVVCFPPTLPPPGVSRGVKKTANLESEVFSMKKRLTALLLLVCMLLTMVPVGVAAEDTEPEPVVEEAVVKQQNEEGGSDDSPEPVASPEPADPCANGHDWGGYVSLGNGQHAQKCRNCDATNDPSSCDYAEATCTAAKTCKVCGDTSGDALGHDWGEWASNGDGTHSRKCKTCSERETKDCSGGTASCTELAKCEVCGASYGDYKHFVTECRHIKTNTHGYYCTNPLCGKLLATETCGYSAATCVSPAKCTKCFNPEGPTDPTNHVGETKAERVPGTETHNIVCQSCGKAIQKDVPCISDGKADCLNKAKCTVCGGEMGELGDHVIKNSPATCNKAAVCDVCGQEVGKPLGHDRDGDGPCKRANCDCTHPDLWKDVDASATSAKCKACGKTVQKTSLNVHFTVNGYGIGKPVSGLSASCDDSRITNVKVSATPNDKTFKAGTKYTITVTYDTAEGCLVASATINGTSASAGNSSAAVDMGEPEKLYTITYKGIDGASFADSLPTEYTASRLPITLPDGSKAHFTFNGWTGNGTNTATKGLTISKGTAKNLTFTASFTADKMTVTFDLNGHGDSFTQTVDYGSKCPTPKTPTDKNVIFDGWMKDGAKYDFSKPVTENITLKASWSNAGYITFKNTTLGTKTYKSGTTINLKKDIGKPKKSGYSFVGWYSDYSLKTPAKSTYTIETGETITLYPKWKRVDPTNPKTGDTQHPELAAGILAISAISLGAVTIFSKKKRIF